MTTKMITVNVHSNLIENIMSATIISTKIGIMLNSRSFENHQIVTREQASTTHFQCAIHGGATVKYTQNFTGFASSMESE